MSDKIKILVVGVGNMGVSHARAYHKLPGFEICGLMSRAIGARRDLPAELDGYPRFQDFQQALAETRPDAVSINTYPKTHATYALRAMDAGCHVFCEKPMATNVEEAKAVVATARAKNRKLVVGYILRVHPALDEVHRDRPHAGQAAGHAHEPEPADPWPGLELAPEPDGDEADRRLRRALRRRHVPDDRRQAGARARHRRAAVTTRPGQYNYGQLQVTFDDGSVGWYEAGWGPMMSEVAFFVKDVVGPKGCVSIVKEPNEATADAARMATSTATRRRTARVHHADIDASNEFTRRTSSSTPRTSPITGAVRSRAGLLPAGDPRGLDLSEHMDDAVNSLRIVLAADESIRTGGRSSCRRIGAGATWRTRSTRTSIANGSTSSGSGRSGRAEHAAERSARRALRADLHQAVPRVGAGAPSGRALGDLGRATG